MQQSLWVIESTQSKLHILGYGRLTLFANLSLRDLYSMTKCSKMDALLEKIILMNCLKKFGKFVLARGGPIRRLQMCLSSAVAITGIKRKKLNSFTRLSKTSSTLPPLVKLLPRLFMSEQIAISHLWDLRLGKIPR